MNRELLYFKKKFEETGRRQGWLESSSILSAVSGGGDSVALLWLLKNFYRGKIAVAHVDHCTRNGASHADAEFVAELCAEWSIPCFIKTVDVENVKLKGESFEMAARRERYVFFDELLEKKQFDAVALGHNTDDLVETQLLNLFRGAGLDGLCGIPEVRGKIVRPVIDFRRSELRALLRQNGISWREDSTNAETVYKRNKVRNELIPWIKENLNENFEISMAGLARQISLLKAEQDEKTEKKLLEISCAKKPALAVWNKNAPAELSDSELSDMLRMQGRKLNLPVLDRKRTEELIRLLRNGGGWRFQWAVDIEVCRNKDGIFWLHRTDIENLKAD